MAKQFITGMAFVEHLCAGLEIDPAMVGRIVIDANVNDAVKVWILAYGREGLLTIEPPSRDDIELNMIGL